MPGQLKVVGSHPTNSNKVLVECSICSVDTELFPAPFEIFKSNVGRRLPCGCSKCPRWTEEQAKILATRSAKSLGYVFLGWAEPYKGSGSTKVECLCPRHGVWRTGILSTLRKGVGCPDCGSEKTWKTRQAERLTEEDLLSRSNWLVGTRFKHLGGRLWGIYCPICSHDEYVKAGVCSGEFVGDYRNISSGQRSCRCGVGYRWTEEQYIYRINTQTDYTFLRWDGKFKGNSTRVVCQCPHHNGEMVMVLSGLLSGNGCMTCFGKRLRPQQETEKLLLTACENKGYSFVRTIDYRGNKGSFVYSCPEHGEQSMSISAMLDTLGGCPECKGKTQTYGYIHSVTDTGVLVALKFGITKNVNMRLKQQNAKSKLDVNLLYSYEFPSVAQCKAAEHEVKTTMPCGILSKQDLPDGWTETISLNHLEQIMKIFEKFGGICVRD